jgi:hypothetical protein
VFKLAQRAVQFVEAFRSNGLDLVVYIDGLALPMKRTAMLARRQRYRTRHWWFGFRVSFCFFWRDAVVWQDCGEG